MKFPLKKHAVIEESIKAESNIKQLIQLALPVIAISFMSMAYSFINILFVGKLGSNAVAAVGSASFFMNLSWGISALLTVGIGIKVSHSMGEKNILLSKSYVRSGILAIIFLAIVYYLLIAIFRTSLIGFISLNNPEIEQSAANYLFLVGMSIPFSFLNLFFSNIFIGYGDSRLPFKITGIAFGLNMLLDPLLIFVAGMGINGAAFATIISQALASILFYRKLNHSEALRPSGVTFRRAHLKNLLGLGLSPAIQRISFTIIAIIMARIISNWGATAIAVQKVGIQIEAITYMTAGGFMSALSSISGKAFGAKDYNKQWATFRSGTFLAFIIGIITSSLFIAFPESLFSIFLKEKKSIEMGSEYLTILGYSQLFMCMESMATGAFFGWGRTSIPAITGISLTVIRIPMTLLFIHFWQNSLISVWWSISISSIAKGIILVLLYIILFKLFIKKQKPLLYESGSLLFKYE